MKLFLISQEQNGGYDTYDSAVVAALDEESAKRIHPSYGTVAPSDWFFNGWCETPADVSVCYIGEAEEDMKQGVICASFNAS